MSTAQGVTAVFCGREGNRSFGVAPDFVVYPPMGRMTFEREMSPSTLL